MFGWWLEIIFLRIFCLLFFFLSGSCACVWVFFINLTSTHWALSTFHSFPSEFFCFIYSFWNSRYMDFRLSALILCSFFPTHIFHCVYILFYFLGEFIHSSSVIDFYNSNFIKFFKAFFLLWSIPFVQHCLFCKWNVFEKINFIKNFLILAFVSSFFFIYDSRLQYLVILGCLLAFKDEVLKSSLEILCSLAELISW